MPLYDRHGDFQVYRDLYFPIANNLTAKREKISTCSFQESPIIEVSQSFGQSFRYYACYIYCFFLFHLDIWTLFNCSFNSKIPFLANLINLSIFFSVIFSQRIKSPKVSSFVIIFHPTVNPFFIFRSFIEVIPGGGFCQSKFVLESNGFIITRTSGG